MDCDKVESLIMDELYGELDQVTSAALKRHVAGCGRCTMLLSGFRATRRVATLPMVEPPPELERRILLAAGTSPVAVAVERPFARVVSAAGSWAMRPQTAMAAVFLVMFGASVLLLRGRSSRAPASSEMIVTEKGTPAPAPIPASPPAASEPMPTPVAAVSPSVRRAPSPQAGPTLDMGPSLARERTMAKAVLPAKPEESPVALAADQASNFAGAAAPAAPAAARGASRSTKGPDGVESESESTTVAASPGLTAARALRDSQGCRAAVARFDEVAQHAAGSSAGWQALLESALCYRSLGDNANARARLTTLLGVAQFKERARSELDQIDRPPASSPPP
jgi:hypothetical protein